MGKGISRLFSAVNGRILLILAGNEGMHKSLDKFEFRPDLTTDYGVSCPCMSYKFMSTFYSVAILLIYFESAGNKDMHIISDEFDFWPDRTTDDGVISPLQSITYPHGEIDFITFC